MAATMKLWVVLRAMVRTFNGKSAARARRSAAPAAFGTQSASYGMSSSLPPMR